MLLGAAARTHDYLEETGGQPAESGPAHLPRIVINTVIEIQFWSRKGRLLNVKWNDQPKESEIDSIFQTPACNT